MRDTMDDSGLDATLRAGLWALPFPTASRDFDVKVLAAVRQGGLRPWYGRIWTTLRPVLSGAACSLLLAFVLVRWASAPAAGQREPRANGPAQEAAAHDVDALTAAVLHQRAAVSAALGADPPRGENLSGGSARRPLPDRGPQLDSRPLAREAEG